MPCRGRGVAWHAVPCGAVPCRDVPCHVMPCDVMSSHVVPCHTMSWPWRGVACRAVRCARTHACVRAHTHARTHGHFISRSDGIAWPTGSSLRPGSKARAIERRNLNLPFVGGFGRGSAAGTWLAEPFAIGTPETRCRDNPINGISMGSKLIFCSMRHSDRSFRHACLHFQSSLHCVSYDA